MERREGGGGVEGLKDARLLCPPPPPPTSSICPRVHNTGNEEASRGAEVLLQTCLPRSECLTRRVFHVFDLEDFTFDIQTMRRLLDLHSRRMRQDDSGAHRRAANILLPHTQTQSFSASL